MVHGLIPILSDEANIDVGKGDKVNGLSYRNAAIDAITGKRYGDGIDSTDDKNGGKDPESIYQIPTKYPPGDKQVGRLLSAVVGIHPGSS
jgi:hypothetical protein